MKIIQIIYYPGQGGAEKNAWLLAKYALSEGHQVQFIFGGKGPLVGKVKTLGASTSYLKMRHPFDIVAAFKLAKIIKQEKPDIIHTHFLRENFIAILASWICPGPKIFSSVHRIEPKNWPQRILNRFFSHWVTSFIVVSGVAKKYLQEEGIRKEKIVVVYNGLDFLPNKRRPEKSQEVITIGYAGRLSPEKNVLLLLQAVAILGDSFAFKIEIAGAGPKEELLKREAKKFQEKVKFLGYVEDLMKYYQNWDIFVLPSRIEVFPFVILEAMSQGVPVVATRISGIEEIIQDKVNGILFETGNAHDLAQKIMFLARDQKIQASIRENAYLSVSKFTAEKMWQAMLKIYKRT